MEEKDGWLNVSHPLPGLSVEVTLEKAPQKKKKKMGLRLQVRKLLSVMVQLSVYKRTQLLKWNEYSERFAYPFCQFLNDL